MNVLSIGNSFSQDAQRYLSRLAMQDGVKLKTANLYIGGCSLQRHYINMLDDKADYDFEFNGETTGIRVSIRQALTGNWDVITLQQVSNLSERYETFSPYLEKLTEYVRTYCPHAKIMLHQTWAYEDNSEKLKTYSTFDSSKKMLAAVCDSYNKAAQQIHADGIIPCGQAMMRAIEMGIGRIHRDTFHASLGAGRYLLALCWYQSLTGRDIANNSFRDFDEPVTEKEREIIIKSVKSVFQ